MKFFKSSKVTYAFFAVWYKILRVNKKSVNFFIFFILVLFLELSCSTMGFTDSDITRDEADYALHIALESSCAKAFLKLKAQLNSIDYIPDEYVHLKENLAIPGLATLKNNMTDYYADYIRFNLDMVEKSIKDLSDSLILRNPAELVKKSAKSASEQLILQHGSEIKKIFAEMLKDAENDSFYACISQYNSYLRLYDIQHKTKTVAYSKVPINIDIAYKLANLFFELLQTSEEYFRTTPNPYADDIVRKVFNIN